MCDITFFFSFCTSLVSYICFTFLHFLHAFVYVITRHFSPTRLTRATVADMFDASGSETFSHPLAPSRVTLRSLPGLSVITIDHLHSLQLRRVLRFGTQEEE